MDKRLILCLLLGILLLAGCASATQTPTLQGAARDEVLTYADPIADNLLAGMKNGDYVAFSKDFNDKMLEAIGPDDFQKMRDQLDPRIGLYLSKEVQQVEDRGEMVTVIYKGVFEKATNVRILLSLMKAAPHQVTGLYFQ